MAYSIRFQSIDDCSWVWQVHCNLRFSPVESFVHIRSCFTCLFTFSDLSDSSKRTPCLLSILLRCTAFNFLLRRFDSAMLLVISSAYILPVTTISDHQSSTLCIRSSQPRFSPLAIFHFPRLTLSLCLSFARSSILSLDQFDSVIFSTVFSQTLPLSQTPTDNPLIFASVFSLYFMSLVIHSVRPIPLGSSLPMNPFIKFFLFAQFPTCFSLGFVIITVQYSSPTPSAYYACTRSVSVSQFLV